MRARYYRCGNEYNDQGYTNNIRHNEQVNIPRRTGIPVFSTMLPVTGSCIRTP